jgi:hypothetical protein
MLSGERVFERVFGEGHVDVVSPLMFPEKPERLHLKPFDKKSTSAFPVASAI